MNQRVKMFVASLGIMFTMALPVLAPAPAHAVNVFEGCKGSAETSVCEASNKDNVFLILRSVINILLTAVGIIAVIMIIVGGIKYVTSSGDSSGITSAKNTILYAIVGLVVALMSFAIVNYVLDNI